MKTINLARSHAELGQHVTVWIGGSGQGGYVTAIDDRGITVTFADIDHGFLWDVVTRLTTEIPHEADECLNYNEDCRGPVDMRWSGGTHSWPRCEYHGDKRLEDREHSMERYADSDCVPDWFDPADAGERWEDE